MLRFVRERLWAAIAVEDYLVVTKMVVNYCSISSLARIIQILDNICIVSLEIVHLKFPSEALVVEFFDIHSASSCIAGGTGGSFIFFRVDSVSPTDLEKTTR